MDKGEKVMLDISREIYRYKHINLEDVIPVGNEFKSKNKNIEKAVTLYNQAIMSLESKSEDIAVIELKKALSLYPDFTEAKMLLSLAYMINHKYNEAEQLLNSVVEGDNVIARASLYLQYIQMKSPSSHNRSPKKVVRIRLPKIQFVGVRGILKLLIVFSIGVMVASFMFKSNSSNQSMNDNALNNHVSILEENVKQLEQQLNEVTNENTYLKKVQELLMIENNIESGNIDEAKNKIEQLKDFTFHEPERQKYDALLEKINQMSTAQSDAAVNTVSGMEAYNKGYTAYKEGKYSEAISYLNEYLKSAPNNTTAQSAWYVLGKSYQAVGDKENAASCYNKVIQDFAGSEYANYARSRLKELNR